MKPGFTHGALLSNPDGLFSDELAGTQWRAIKVHKGDRPDEGSLQALVRVAVGHNRAKRKK